MNRALLISGTLMVPLATGLALAWLGEQCLPGALVLLTEPAWFLGGVYLVLLSISHRQWATAGGLAAGVLLAGQLQRRPVTPSPAPPGGPSWVPELARCAAIAPNVSPLRLVTWTVDDDPKAPMALLDGHPDLVVLRGVDDPGVGEALAVGLDGEAMFVPGTPHGTSIVANGNFQFCGGQADHWEIPLRAGPGRQAKVIISFPMIRGGGVVPLEVIQLDRAGPPSDWPGWPQRLLDGARSVAASAIALDSPHVVIIGDFGVPRTFRRVDAELSSAALTQLPLPASWPARIGPLPTPTLQARDRVWVGRNWRAHGGQRLRIGHGTRAPVQLDLIPDAGR